jgi:hypothetical protein
MGTFTHHPDGYFVIDGERFSEEVFLSVEPGYALDPAFIGRHYDQSTQHWLTDGSNTTEGEHPWTQGDIYINRLSDFQAARADDEQADSDAEDAAEQAVFDSQTPAEKRRLSYPKNSEMIEALWRHIVEGEDLSTSGCQAIQDERDAIRAQYPDV